MVDKRMDFVHFTGHLPTLSPTICGPFKTTQKLYIDVCVFVVGKFV